MGMYGPKKGMSVGAAALTVAAVLVGGYFGRAAVDSYFHSSGDMRPFPTASAAAVVKDDPVLHKKFRPYLKQLKFTGTYEVSRPSSKSFRISLHISSKELQESANTLAGVMGLVYGYLSAKDADPKTKITLTLTNGKGEVYDPSSLGLKPIPTLKEVKKFIDQFKE